MAQQTDSFEFKDENARFGIKDEWMNKPLHIGGQKQQTAVEWLVEQYANENYGIEVYEQAKQMEKEQMKGMYTEGGFAQMRYFNGKEFITAEQYYNETYTTN